jgi:hypothetical protein
MHWVPLYVRNELKNKTGIHINEYGEKIDNNGEMESNQLRLNNITNPNDLLINMKEQDMLQKGKQSKKEYTPIKSYKPSGNLIYDDDVLNKIENKFL